MMKNYNGLFFIFFIVLWANNSMASAQPSVYELYLRALQYDDSYLDATSELNIERLDLKSLRTKLYPSITSSVYRTETQSDTKGPQQSVTSDGRYSSDGFQVNVNQVIYDPALLDQLDSYQLLTHSIKNKIISAQNELLLKVANGYWSLMLAQQAVLEEQKKSELQKILVGLAHEQHSRGLISISELNQLASDNLEQDYQTTLAAINLDVARGDLFQLTLWESQANAITSISCPLADDLDKPAADYLNQAILGNTQLNTWRDELKAYQKERESKKSAYYPKLNLSADYTNTDQTGGSFDGSQTNRTQLKLSLDWPIYLGGQRYFDVKKSAYRLAAQQRKIELFVPKLKQKLKLLSMRLTAGKTNLKKIKLAVKISNQKYQIVLKELQAGSVTQATVLQEGVRVAQLTTKKISACKDQLLNQLEFFKLLGALDAKQLD